MNAPVTSNDALVHQVTIKGPADQIFEALINPEAVVRWWGVEGKFQVTQMECDPRLGGKWRMHVRGSNGAISTVAGEYRKIERPHLLVFTWIREQEDMPETIVQWDLEEKNGFTTVRVTHSGLNSEFLRERHSGWPLILTLLQGHIEPQRKNR